MQTQGNITRIWQIQLSTENTFNLIGISTEENIYSEKIHFGKYAWSNMDFSMNLEKPFISGLICPFPQTILISYN